MYDFCDYWRRHHRHVDRHATDYIYPDARIALLEKESGPACHQTGHNSGVIHAGVYYTPGSLKTQFCLAGEPRH